MTRWGAVMAVTILTGCPTVKEVSYTVVPAERLATVRLHDVRSDDGSEGDWRAAAGLLTLLEGAELVGGEVRFEEVDAGLDVVATLGLPEGALASVFARLNDVGLWCGGEAVLRTNGHDLTEVLGTPCVGWGPTETVYELTLAGDATDAQPSVLSAWRAAGAPASVSAEEPLDP